MGLTGFNRRRRAIVAAAIKQNVSPVSEMKQEPVKEAEEPKVETKVEEPVVETKEVKEPSAKKATKK